MKNQSPLHAFVLSILLGCTHTFNVVNQPSKVGPSRRDLLQLVMSAPLIATGTASASSPVMAAESKARVTGPNDGNLKDLPPEAVRSYLQYRVPLQVSADFYVFELQPLLGDVQQWGEVGELFQVNNNRGQGNPSRIEREFTNVFRILGLSMPPEYADEMRDAQFAFEAAMARLSKATAGIRRDLPVELDKNAVPDALASWDDGRKAINKFFSVLSEATGLNEMKMIPAPGPQQLLAYGRSERRYLDLKKKIKLCQNRGGPTLSQAWGQLMVTGTVQDSCGIPDLDEYFYQ